MRVLGLVPGSVLSHAPGSELRILGFCKLLYQGPQLEPNLEQLSCRLGFRGSAAKSYHKQTAYPTVDDINPAVP